MRAISILLLVASLLAGTSVTSAQTRELLAAPRVQSRLRVRWDPALRRIVASLDEESRFRSLAPSQQIVAEGPSVTVTYPRLNPLRVTATMTRSGEPPDRDPLTARLRALMAFAAVSVPTLEGGAHRPSFDAAESPAQCEALRIARADAEVLMVNLSGAQGSVTVPAIVQSWRRAIDEAFDNGQDGASAVKAAAALMEKAVARLDAQMRDSDRVLSRIEREAPKSSAAPCESLARTLYDAVQLSSPRARLAQLAAVRAAIVAVQETLSRDYILPGAAKWQGSDFRLAAEVRPTRESSTGVTIHVTDLYFDVDKSSGALTAVEERSDSQALVIQRFSRFAREFAVATVIGSVTRPGYGTATNGAGVTVVGRLRRPRISVEPAVLASFVCQCRTGPLIAPMLQIGITTSKDVPALLAGGGIRLFGLPKGDVALGAGAMIAWVQDLRTLQVDHPAGGTSDIDADLHAVRKHGGYFALQYKF